MPAIMPQASEPLPTDVCAVVLAAGEGRRLRPLSLVRPKPLCPVGGVPLLDLAIERARTAVMDVAVNVHHGRDRIESHLDGARVHVSVEEPEALGTAGALAQLRPWIDGRGVLVLNGDTWAPGDLAAVTAGWDRERVRLLVVGDDRLRPPARPTNLLAGALMPWSEVAGLAPVPSGLWEVSWRAAQAEHRIDVVRWDGPCIDCGTPARYLAANLAANGGASVVGEGAVVAGTVERSVGWSGARVDPGEALVDAVRTDAGVTVLVR
ncbi:MAG: NTP transferase domain-containing protein [Acidimicrobiales bacterium]|nr:NTP transferase domain-containing protein [Acidimicrobiales bacterium]